jgi:hypothetical protein
VGLTDRIVRALALRWLRGRVDAARKRGSSVLRFLDGQKRLIVVLGFIVSGFVALLTGQDVGQWLDLLLRALGWQDAAIIADAKELATQIVPLLFAIWAAAHALWGMWKQHKAGARASELGSPVGVIRAAVADGTVKVVAPEPMVLRLTETAPKKGEDLPFVAARIQVQSTMAPVK